MFVSKDLPGRHGRRGPRGAAAKVGLRRFAPGLWATAATLSFVALVALGTWQLERLAWKRDLIARPREAQLAAPAAPLPTTADDWQAWDFRPVKVQGEFRHDLEQLFGVAAIDGRSAITCSRLGPARWRRHPDRSRLGACGPGASGCAPLADRGP